MFKIRKIQKPFKRTSYTFLPSTTGVYAFMKSNTYLYIGKSSNLKARVFSHVESSRMNPKEYKIISQTDSMQYAITENEFSALLLESRLIQKHHPKYNVVWRDGKSHLYIKITDEEFPKIVAVRRENDGKSMYFGPFSSAKDVTVLLRFIRKIIPFCTQKKITRKACFYSKIGQCNPCPNIIHFTTDSKEAKKLRLLYLKNIRRIKSILKGKESQVLHSLHISLKDAIQNQNYEEGISFRNKIQTFEHLLRFRSFETDMHDNFNRSAKSIESLLLLIRNYFQDVTNLKRIECYDISNLSQKQATGAMVVFTNGLADKGEYKRFRIRDLNLVSDFEMLEEILKRRFANKWPHPDLIVVDGGKPQVRTFLKLSKSIGIKIPIIGMAKRPDRIIIGIPTLPSIKPKIDDPGYRLLQYIRDESHRFAHKYHLFLRSKSML
ncbi:MAG: GIY-YIG nuclease family protein [Patescibacteria group bacterium]